MVTDDRPAASGQAANGLDATDLVRRYYPALVRFARFEGADDGEVESALRAAWLEASTEPDEVSFRRRVVRELLGRVAGLERAAGRRLDSALERDPEPVVPASAFNGPDAAWAHFFRAMPRRFARLEPGGRRAAEAATAAEAAILAMPLAQRAVVVLRDVAGWPAAETAEILGIDPALQRNLLHAGRGRVRRALEALVRPRRSVSGG